MDPVISKIRNYYHKNIMLKIESDSSIKKAKEILSKTIEVYKDLKQFRSIKDKYRCRPLLINLNYFCFIDFQSYFLKIV